MRSVLTHLVVVAACGAMFQSAVAQDLNPALDLKPAADFDPAEKIEPEHVVRSILQDTEGRLWFGTWRNGVYRFENHELTLFTTHDGLADNQVRTVLEDQRGATWFETAKGNSRFDAGVISTRSHRAYLTKDDWRIEPGDLWFKADGHFDFNERESKPGVYRFDGTTFHYHAFPIEMVTERRGDYSVTGIDQSKEDRVWIATYGVVIGFDGNSFTIIDDASLGHTDHTGYLHARCVFEDSKGRVWIGNNGIGVVMREGESTINFTQAHGVGRRFLPSGAPQMAPRPGDAPAGQPSLHRVFSIGEDRDGNIWFGTIDQGAWRYDGVTLRQFTEADGLNTKQVTAIYTDRQGDLWVGGNGVFKFNGTAFERQF
jgi:ligand-binding sensor domain-containing protein